MKTCSECNEKVSPEEGRLNEKGRFICLTCAEEAGDPNASEKACPECGETTREFGEEGVCPACGHETEEGSQDAESAPDEAEKEGDKEDV